MERRGKTIAIALTGAVALASGAYALGTQAGGGSATASDNPRPTADVRFAAGGGPPGFGLEGLADRLGVSEEKLEDALRELRDDSSRPDFEEYEKQLADALGVSTERLREAFENVRGSLRDRIERGLPDGARKLCEDGAPRPPDAPDKPGRPGAFFFGPGLGGNLATALAKELGLEEDKVDDALDEVGDRQREQFEQRRKEFNQQLADKLGIPVERVEDAFPLLGRHP